MSTKKDTQDISKEFNLRIELFDKEFRALQAKYNIRLVAQYLTPVNPADLAGAMLITTVPIQAIPTGDFKPEVAPEEIKAE